MNTAIAWKGSLNLINFNRIQPLWICLLYCWLNANLI